MTKIPSQCLVLVTDALQASIDNLAEILTAPVVVWQDAEAKASLSACVAAVAKAEALIVLLPRPSNSEAKTLARMARKNGLIPVIQTTDASTLADTFDIVLPDLEDLSIGPMPFDKRDDHGPFDIIGDVHGCAVELMELLAILGHAAKGWEEAPADCWHAWIQAHRTGRRVILLGDLTDRGPSNLASLRIARAIERVGGYLIAGNHDDKLARWMKGRPVTIAHGLATTVQELENIDHSELQQFSDWLLSRPRHLILDGGQLVVAHAGLAEHLHERATPAAAAFATYGKPAGHGVLDQDGFPEREDWAQDYKGKATVVHGHVVHSEPRELNRVFAIDTGCVFGGKLTALRWPERTYEQVSAHKVYSRQRQAESRH